MFFGTCHKYVYIDKYILIYIKIRFDMFKQLYMVKLIYKFILELESY